MVITKTINGRTKPPFGKIGHHAIPRTHLGVSSSRWEEYERLKKSLPDSLSPSDYNEAILTILKKLHL